MWYLQLNTVLVNNNAVLAIKYCVGKQHNAVLAIKYCVGKQHNAVLAIHFTHHEASTLCHL